MRWTHVSTRLTSRSPSRVATTRRRVNWPGLWRAARVTGCCTGAPLTDPRLTHRAAGRRSSADSLARMDLGDWDAVDAVDWAAYGTAAAVDGGPIGSVPDSLRHLMTARDEETAKEAASRMLNAVAHNHSGVLFPIVLPAVPFLAQIAVDPEPWPSYAAVQVLIDVIDFSIQSGHVSAVRAGSVLTALQPARARLENLAYGDTDRQAPAPRRCPRPRRTAWNNGLRFALTPARNLH